MGLIDFAAGVGQAGVQLGTDALRSMIEEEKSARLMEMQQRHARVMQGEALAHSADQGRLGREATASEGRATREHQATLAGNAERAADRRQAAGFTHAENLQANALAHAEYLSDQTRALQERQLGISAGHLRLARDQAAMGKQIIGEDGRIAFVTPDGNGGARVSGYLKGPDGKDFVVPKNISEAAKLEFTAIGERIKALDKSILEAANPAAADRARAEIMTLTDQQRRILHGDRQAPAPGGAPEIKDRGAQGAGDARGNAEFEDMKRRGAQAGPLGGTGRTPTPGAAPSSAKEDDPEPARYEGVGRARRETSAWQEWKKRENERSAEQRANEIRRARELSRGGMIGG